MYLYIPCEKLSKSSSSSVLSYSNVHPPSLLYRQRRGEAERWSCLFSFGNSARWALGKHNLTLIHPQSKEFYHSLCPHPFEAPSFPYLSCCSHGPQGPAEFFLTLDIRQKTKVSRFFTHPSFLLPRKFSPHPLRYWVMCLGPKCSVSMLRGTYSLSTGPRGQPEREAAAATATLWLQHQQHLGACRTLSWPPHSPIQPKWAF